MPALRGPRLADPRKVCEALRARGMTPWLDIEVLGGGSGLFGDIAKGLKAAKLVVLCVSDEYANSENCRMEASCARAQPAPAPARSQAARARPRVISRGATNPVCPRARVHAPARSACLAGTR